MVEIPYSFLSYCPDNPARGRWDQRWIERILAGEEWLPPGGYTLVDTLWNPKDGRGRVIVFPCGHYHDHGEKHIALMKLRDDLEKLPWAIVIATSDECSTFEWHKFDPWPEHVYLWVMTPRPEHTYPPGTKFIGEGSPTPAREMYHGAPLTRDLDVFFSGQGGHERRDSLQSGFVGASALPMKMKYQFTEGFSEGMDRDEYIFHMNRTWVAPAPAGPCTQDSFRAFEALEAGCIPLVDAYRPGHPGSDYWNLIGMGWLPSARDWSLWLGNDILGLLYPDRCLTAARINALWQAYKRATVTTLHRQLDDLTQLVDYDDDFEERITVIIPVSPIPSHPSTEIVAHTVNSIRERLPRAEILITCDGVRPEQQHRQADYSHFLHRLCLQANADWFNVLPVIFHEHMHQSGMMRSILREVKTPFVLYVEQDTPLVGDIPFDEIVYRMIKWEIASVRFMHETHILPDHEHLFLGPVTSDGPVTFEKTIQWSQRPHLASTKWYQNIMSTYFGEKSRTFIEDVMHGVVQFDSYASRMHAEEAWRKWRMAVYAPEGSWKRSTHTNGRAGDPKYPMKVAYDGERPPDAPAPGIIG